MPIAVACTCGVKLKAPDAAAGKRVKCPKCGAGLLVPVPAPEPDFEFVDDEPAPPPVAAVAKPVAKPKPQLIADDEDEPRPAKKKPRLLDDEEDAKPAKKKAAKPVEVDEPVDDEDEKPKKKSRRDRDEEQEAPKKKSRRDPDDEDEKPAKKSRRSRDDDEDEDAPKKGKKKSNLPLILGIGGGVLVLAVVGIVVGVILNNNNDKVQDPKLVVPEGASPDAAKPYLEPEQLPPPTLPKGWAKHQLDGFSVGLPAGLKFQPLPETGKPVAPILETKGWNAPSIVNLEVSLYVAMKSKIDPNLVSHYQYNPPKTWDELMKSSSVPGSSEGKVRTCKLGGLTGRQTTKEVPSKTKSVMTVCMVIKGDYMYVVGYASKDATDDDPAAKAYFDTFRFEDTGPNPPGGSWKTFRGEGFSVQIPDSVTLTEKVFGPGEKPSPPLATARDWVNVDAKRPTPAVAIYEIEVGQVEPKFAALYEQNPTAAWEEYLRLIKVQMGGTNTKLVLTETTLGGEPAKQFVAKLPSGVTFIGRVVMKGTTMYSAGVGHKDASETDPLVKPFFDSFRFEK